MLLTSKHKTFKSTKYFCVLSFLTIAINVSIAKLVHNILVPLSGDVQLNLGPKNKFDVNYYAKVFFLKAVYKLYRSI